MYTLEFCDKVRDIEWKYQIDFMAYEALINYQVEITD